MAERRTEEATLFLARASRGDAGALEALIPLVYEELRALGRKLLAREAPDHTLQATALVHEAYLKLVDQTGVDWKSKTHFLAVAAQQMRRVLVDHARARHASKRGHAWVRVVLDAGVSPTESREFDPLELEEALADLSRLNERHGRIVVLRFFGGLSVEETAEALGVSPRTVEWDWRYARAWLRDRLGPDREDR